MYVEGNHNFYVGVGGALVHNCRLVKHHLFPAFRKNEAKQKFFKELGIKPDDFTQVLRDDVHKSLTPQWNRDWELFMNTNPRASGEEVFRFMEDLRRKYGIDGGTIVRYGRNTQIP